MCARASNFNGSQVFVVVSEMFLLVDPTAMQNYLQLFGICGIRYIIYPGIVSISRVVYQVSVDIKLIAMNIS